MRCCCIVSIATPLSLSLELLDNDERVIATHSQRKKINGFNVNRQRVRGNCARFKKDEHYNSYPRKFRPKYLIFVPCVSAEKHYYRSDQCTFYWKCEICDPDSRTEVHMGGPCQHRPRRWPSWAFVSLSSLDSRYVCPTPTPPLQTTFLS